MNKVKQDLLQIFQAAIHSVNGKHVVSNALSQQQEAGPYHVIAIGKAADDMLQGVPTKKIINALLISKHGHITSTSRQNARFICIESDHPVPKKASILAGKALLNYLSRLAPEAPCLFLISGGASALVEVLDDDWSLSELAKLTEFLLSNAYPIDEINAIRRKISKIKGGGLWHYLGQRPVTALLISDVPNDKPEDIGSGLLFPSKEENLPQLPLRWSSKIQPRQSVRSAKNFQWKIIASLSMAKQAAANKARQLGYTPNIVPNFIQGQAINIAQQCVKSITQQPQTLFIWGGETTVILPPKPGKGGRNQHLALAAAIQMKDLQSSYLLAAGTDGSDGLSNATGALVDNHTINKAEQKGLKALDFLQTANTHEFFQATGEAIITGATGTNVMDLVIAIKETR